MNLNLKLRKHFSDAIRLKMRENSITQVQLSELSGLTQSQISALLGLHGNPTIKTVARALEALS